jgi:type II secretory pathway pseudopilin PulG
MTNVEARRNDRIRIISTPRSRLRHSGFDIPSSFVIRTSLFRAERAVTIIELLVVIIIILILAGLVLSISSYVQNKGARARAETEIAAISAALESYKADNGIYPANNATNSLDPTTMTDPSSPSYVSASNYLYIQLSGDSDGNPTTTSSSDTRNYLSGSLRQSMLTPNPPGANTYFHDPFRNRNPSSSTLVPYNSYGYSTSKNPMANPTGYTSANGYNPTFDLWSTAGTGTIGTPSPSPIQNQWIKNW